MTDILHKASPQTFFRKVELAIVNLKDQPGLPKNPTDRIQERLERQSEKKTD